MEIRFQIELIFDPIIRKGPHLMAKLLDTNQNIKLTDNTTLGGIKIKQFNLPRVVDGVVKLALFVFQLENKSELKNFRKGQIVKLTN